MEQLPAVPLDEALGLFDKFHLGRPVGHEKGVDRFLVGLCSQAERIGQVDEITGAVPESPPQGQDPFGVEGGAVPIDLDAGQQAQIALEAFKQEGLAKKDPDLLGPGVGFDLDDGERVSWSRTRRRIWEFPGPRPDLGPPSKPGPAPGSIKKPVGGRKRRRPETNAGTSCLIDPWCDPSWFEKFKVQSSSSRLGVGPYGE